MLELLDIAPAWAAGLEPEARAESAANSSIIIAAIALAAILIIFNYSSVRQLLIFNFEELISVRHGRDNVFDERPATLAIVQAALAAIAIGCAGIFIAAFSDHIPSARNILAAITIAAAYYFFELAAYQAVGFTFSSSEGRRQWIRGFNASISLLAVLIAFPAAFAVFYPQFALIMAFFALFAFLFAKFLFIIKGFRIFFDNFFSLLYFILYLCTLEIIPLIFACKMASDFLRV